VPPSVIDAEADLVVIAGLLPQPEPGRAGQTYPYYVYDAYRVRDGMLVEHWRG
jgi:predicted SnoaL-like aldol condensation-catalyzing enzyme